MSPEINRPPKNPENQPANTEVAAIYEQKGVPPSPTETASDSVSQSQQNEKQTRLSAIKEWASPYVANAKNNLKAIGEIVFVSSDIAYNGLKKAMKARNEASKISKATAKEQASNYREATAEHADQFKSYLGRMIVSNLGLASPAAPEGKIAPHTRRNRKMESKIESKIVKALEKQDKRNRKAASLGYMYKYGKQPAHVRRAIKNRDLGERRLLRIASEAGEFEDLIQNAHPSTQQALLARQGKNSPSQSVLEKDDVQASEEVVRKIKRNIRNHHSKGGLNQNKLSDLEEELAQREHAHQKLVNHYEELSSAEAINKLRWAIDRDSEYELAHLREVNSRQKLGWSEDDIRERAHLIVTKKVLDNHFGTSGQELFVQVPADVQNRVFDLLTMSREEIDKAIDEETGRHSINIADSEKVQEIHRAITNQLRENLRAYISQGGVRLTATDLSDPNFISMLAEATEQVLKPRMTQAGLSPKEQLELRKLLRELAEQDFRNT